MIERRKGLRAESPKRRRERPVRAAARATVLARDRGCVAAQRGFPGICGSVGDRVGFEVHEVASRGTCPGSHLDPELAISICPMTSRRLHERVRRQARPGPQARPGSATHHMTGPPQAIVDYPQPTGSRCPQANACTTGDAGPGRSYLTGPRRQTPSNGDAGMTDLSHPPGAVSDALEWIECARRYLTDEYALAVSLDIDPEASALLALERAQELLTAGP